MKKNPEAKQKDSDFFMGKFDNQLVATIGSHSE